MTMKKPYTVLIVDDSVHVLKLLEAGFSRTSYNVKTVSNPVLAFDIIQKEHIDIVVSDIEMPYLKGLELLKKIKSYNGMIQVLIITGYTSINNALNAFRYGAENIFFKPVDIKEVIKGVDMCAAKLDRVNHLLNELKKENIP